MPLRRELARTLVIGEVVALERDGGRLILLYGMAQILLHRLHVGKQLLLFLCEAVRPLFAAAVLDKVQTLNAGIAVPGVCGIDAAREDGTCGSQRK